ncbi:MAG: hypothetical protein GY793_01580 [Proteobacteria bacterium]|nr:hypothetical protein [Pseudomonadota bacterium]
MGRERTPLKREYKGKVIINIRDIFRNPDIQDNVIKEVKKIDIKITEKNGTNKRTKDVNYKHD